MKKFFYYSFCLTLACISSLRAEVIYVTGEVYGIWSADTVLVSADTSIGGIRIPTDSTLIIEPGVKVLFWDYCKFIVDSNATLIAVGTEEDTILFDEYWEGNHWKGIRFLNASDSCRLEYCHLTNGEATGIDQDNNGGSIYCFYSNITVNNCLINNCVASNYGGGLHCEYSNATLNCNSIISNAADYGGGIFIAGLNAIIDSCFINSNFAYHDGGGIGCGGDSTIISNNTITENYTEYWGNGGGGGGFILWGSNAEIIGNIISDNECRGLGGGILMYDSNVFIENNIIEENIVHGWADYIRGGALCVRDNSNCEIINNTISGNYLTGGWGSHGGGIRCEYSDPLISGNTISQNSCSRYGGGISCDYSDPEISDNIINLNPAGGFSCLY